MISVCPDKQLTPRGKKEQLKERDRFGEATQQLYADGKYDEAIAAAEKILAIERTVLGSDSPDALGSLAQIASAHEAQEDFAPARKFRDEATASLIEVWIDETERRTWFLFESSQRGMTGGH